PKLSLAIAEAGAKGDRATMDALMKKYVHPLYALRASPSPNISHPSAERPAPPIATRLPNNRP
ncbi:MAG: hypothetical protein ACK6D7_13675, partial [Acidobacteriota bacterium]